MSRHAAVGTTPSGIQQSQTKNHKNKLLLAVASSNNDELHGQRNPLALTFSVAFGEYSPRAGSRSSTIRQKPRITARENWEVLVLLMSGRGFV